MTLKSFIISKGKGEKKYIMRNIKLACNPMKKLLPKLKCVWSKKKNTQVKKKPIEKYNA